MTTAATPPSHPDVHLHAQFFQNNRNRYHDNLLMIGQQPTPPPHPDTGLHPLFGLAYMLRQERPCRDQTKVRHAVFARAKRTASLSRGGGVPPCASPATVYSATPASAATATTGRRPSSRLPEKKNQVSVLFKPCISMLRSLLLYSGKRRRIFPTCSEKKNSSRRFVQAVFR